MDKEKEKIINLNPIFLQDAEERGVLKLNIIFLTIFNIFQVFLICYILYYFFKTELKFIYNNIFKKADVYTDQELKINKEIINKVKTILETPINCTKISSIKLKDGRVIDNNFLLTYKYNNLDKYVKTLDDDYVYFNDLVTCENFLLTN